MSVAVGWGKGSLVNGAVPSLPTVRRPETMESGAKEEEEVSAEKYRRKDNTGSRGKSLLSFADLAADLARQPAFVMFVDLYWRLGGVGPPLKRNLLLRFIIFTTGD